MNSVMFGHCNICGKEDYLSVKTYEYDLKCECHSPYHFERIEHCSNCVPSPPTNTLVWIKPKGYGKSEFDAKLMLEIAHECGLQTVGEAIMNVRLRVGQLFEPEDYYNMINDVKDYDMSEEDLVDEWLFKLNGGN